MDSDDQDILGLRDLVTERVSDELADLDTLDVDALVGVMNDAEAEVPRAVRAAASQISAAISAISERMIGGGRLLYVGAGTPGRLGFLDAAECPPTFSTPPELIRGIIAGGPSALISAVEGAEDDEAAGIAAMELHEVGPRDSVVGITASGRTPFVLAALAEARRRGACAVGLSCNPNAKLSAHVDYPIEVIVGPEVIAGSTRLKAGSAQKQVLNMISTISMIRLGKTYGNLMVDLHATNAKLWARARGLVEKVTGASPAEAGDALEAAGGHAATAIVMLSRGLTCQQATEALASAGGRLRGALGE